MSKVIFVSIGLNRELTVHSDKLLFTYQYKYLLLDFKTFDFNSDLKPAFTIIWPMGKGGKHSNLLANHGMFTKPIQRNNSINLYSFFPATC